MSLFQHFAELPDPRSHNNRTYDLLDIVLLSVCAVLSGAEGWKDIEKFGHKKLAWLRKFRRFEAGIPVDDTVARIIRNEPDSRVPPRPSPTSSHASPSKIWMQSSTLSVTMRRSNR